MIAYRIDGKSTDRLVRLVGFFRAAVGAGRARITQEHLDRAEAPPIEFLNQIPADYEPPFVARIRPPRARRSCSSRVGHRRVAGDGLD